MPSSASEMTRPLLGDFGEVIKDNAGTRRLGPSANPRGSRSLVVHHAHALMFHRLSPPLLSWPTTSAPPAAASSPSDVREFIPTSPSSQGPGRCQSRRAAFFFDSSTARRIAVVHGSGTARADVVLCHATSLAPSLEILWSKASSRQARRGRNNADPPKAVIPGARPCGPPICTRAAPRSPIQSTVSQLINAVSVDPEENQLVGASARAGERLLQHL
ncbi:hypothetical protein BKA81DRAFT_377421 [Phyllosticta paracitricarpa]|uniref:Uncharacterized protein n=2 Tax=Phyllosticta TaxID=121621 RepID=A0ABR1MBH2_9PEZI